MSIKQNIACASLAFLTLSTTAAEVQNGDFESWSNDKLTDWSVIDSGIQVAKTDQIKKTGSAAAAITVNTSNQGNTDFLQSIAVEAGKSYQFSTWVYHTEGKVKARLLVDGYQNYSNEAVTNQWQQLSFDYAATENKQINVGLRFYDVSGFDGSEVVYVDDFQPRKASVVEPVGCSAHLLKLNLTTDQYGYETSWQLKNAAGEVQAQAGDLENNKLYQTEHCLADGEYSFTINDSYGDGICCNYGNGSYELSVAGKVVAAGASFNRTENKTFILTTATGGNNGAENYYEQALNKTGFELKTALHTIIKAHTVKGYSALWTFYQTNALDNYYEKDGSILDIYSEQPTAVDSHSYTKVTDQCGNYTAEGGCYNREHSFPKSWFGGKVEPMNSDVHHIFATDGFVNAKRSSYPYGEVGSASYTSSNNSKLGTAKADLGYAGTVFEPIDEFKGDLARAHLYMATRYQDVINAWLGNSVYGDAILDGSSDKVFKPWVIAMLLRWHQLDPVSQKEVDRNNASFEHQGNRNPFIDHPEFVNAIWGN